VRSVESPKVKGKYTSKHHDRNRTAQNRDDTRRIRGRILRAKHRRPNDATDGTKRQLQARRNTTFSACRRVVLAETNRSRYIALSTTEGEEKP